MLKKVILGGIVGGIIVFLWGFVSHMVLPFYARTFRKFTLEPVVGMAVKANAPEAGLYVLPWMDPGGDEAAMAEHQKRMTEGPFILAAVQPQGARGFGEALGLTLLQVVVSAGLMTWLLLHASPRGPLGRVLFVEGVALFATTVLAAPNWVWWGYPSNFTIVLVLDILVGWGLAGLALAKIAGAGPVGETSPDS